MQVGNKFESFANLCYMVPRMLEGGKNLKSIEREIHTYQKLAHRHRNKVLALCMQCYQDTIDLLCDDSSTTNVTLISDESVLKEGPAVHLVRLIMPHCYLRHMERVTFFAKKWESMGVEVTDRCPFRKVAVAFYSGLARLALHRQRKFGKISKDISQCIKILSTGKYKTFVCSGLGSSLTNSASFYSRKHVSMEL